MTDAPAECIITARRRDHAAKPCAEGTCATMA
eukprot:CAMPEP_0205945660 /NCGR_PEP_ID=MMETSP1325-20131115/66795_1 /ASSEMBLY_ACC=CAM_ASM_000708 /TAXON_ID=236786 /ORGANISM="Florenciella sp., Strain RCC1007" /LENGTH=31 /DNA_ID= /DNA_START= /DNA_END= /DNA_ORIENTATION=